MTKQELREYYWIQKNIKQLEEKLLELETEATRQTTHLSNVPKSENYDKDRFANIVVKIVEVKEKINKEVSKSYDTLAKIESAIYKLPHREQYLIRARYIELKSWEQIAVEMNYSWQHIHRIHANALAMLDPKRKDESK